MLRRLPDWKWLQASLQGWKQQLRCYGGRYQWESNGNHSATLGWSFRWFWAALKVQLKALWSSTRGRSSIWSGICSALDRGCCVCSMSEVGIAVVSKAWLWRGASKLAVPEPWLNGCTEITEIERCCAHSLKPKSSRCSTGISCTPQYVFLFGHELHLHWASWAGSCSSTWRMETIPTCAMALTKTALGAMAMIPLKRWPEGEAVKPSRGYDQRLSGVSPSGGWFQASNASNAINYRWSGMIGGAVAMF